MIYGSLGGLDVHVVSIDEVDILLFWNFRYFRPKGY